MTIEDLNSQIEACKNCKLGKDQEKRIHGIGSGNPELMIVGEAPGSANLKSGEPFSDKRAKDIIHKVLIQIGISEDRVWKTNVLKCPTPGFRDPYDGEVRACQKFLNEEIRLLNPKVILSMGRTPAYFFTGNKGTVKDLRGKVRWYKSKPVVITYHPSGVKRFPFLEAQLMEDLELFKTLVKKNLKIDITKHPDWTQIIHESLETL